MICKICGAESKRNLCRLHYNEKYRLIMRERRAREPVKRRRCKRCNDFAKVAGSQRPYWEQKFMDVKVVEVRKRIEREEAILRENGLKHWDSYEKCEKILNKYKKSS